MAGTLKVDSINADSNLALKIANTAVAFIDASGLRPVAGNLNLDATATSKFYLPSANTVAIQTAGVTAVTVDSSQNVTLAAALAVTGVTTVQAGTAALPAITTTGDTNTGIFFSAADTIDFTEGGTATGQFDSSGNFKFNSGYGSVATAYGCRAWVNFNGTGTVAIRASGGVSSITDNGTGDYMVNLTTAMPDANYSAVSSGGTGSNNIRMSSCSPSSLTSTSEIRVLGITVGAAGLIDLDAVSVAVFR